MVLDVRDEAPGDRADVRRIVTAAFGRAAEADLVDRIRADGDAVFSLVATVDDAVAGHVLFSRLTASFHGLALAPVSVEPQLHGRGIGGALIRAGLDRAEGDGWDLVVVLGDPGYYRRFGFDSATVRRLETPYAGPFLMGLSVSAGFSPGEGAIEYPPAFAALPDS